MTTFIAYAHGYEKAKTDAEARRLREQLSAPGSAIAAMFPGGVVKLTEGPNG